MTDLSTESPDVTLDEDDTMTVLTRSLEDAACHASELHELVQAAADRLGDDHLYLAARSLQELNEDLNELAYNGGEAPTDE
jgi:hypothetical protein